MNSNLYNHTKLSPDIISIINRYLDQTLKNLTRILEKNRKWTIRKDITFSDILVFLVNIGMTGFFIRRISNENLISYVDKLEKEIPISTIGHKDNLYKYYYIKELDMKHYCDITVLDIF
jgi:hypothetical protein